MDKKAFKEYWHSRPDNVSYEQAQAYSLVHEDDCYFSRSEIFWDRVRILGLGLSVGLIPLGAMLYFGPPADNKKQPESIQNSLEQKATNESEFKELELIKPESRPVK